MNQHSIHSFFAATDLIAFSVWLKSFSAISNYPAVIRNASYIQFRNVSIWLPVSQFTTEFLVSVIEAVTNSDIDIP